MLLLALAVGACAPAAEPQVPVPTPTPAVVLTATAAVVVREQKEGPSQAEIAGIEVDPPFLRVKPGETVELRARAVDQNLQEIPGARILWTVVNIQAGAVSEEGAFTAGTTPGTYEGALQVTATQEDGELAHLASTRVTVVVDGTPSAGSRLATIHIVPDPIQALQGQVLRLHALGLDKRGVVIPSVHFSWSLRDTSLGSIDDVGTLKVTTPVGVYDGAVQVEASYQGTTLRARVQLRVVEAFPARELMNVQILPNSARVEPGGSFDFRAVALDKLGQPLSKVEVRWSVVDGEAGFIEDTGRFHAGPEPGVYTHAVRVDITQRSEGNTLTSHAFATVVVERNEPLALAGVVLRPRSVVLLPGEGTVFTARALDRYGQGVPGARFSWRVSDVSLGTVTQNGRFAASGQPGVYLGAVEVQVEKDGVVRLAVADVAIAGTLSQARISPTRVEVGRGEGVAFSATGLDENGVEIPTLVFQWEVLDPRAGTINQLGYFTAGTTPGVYEGVIQVRVIQR